MSISIRCFSPPSSPCRRASQAAARPALKSKLLAALDADLAPMLGTAGASPKPIQPFTLGSESTASQTATPQSTLKSAQSTLKAASTTKAKTTDENTAPSKVRATKRGKSQQEPVDLPLYSYKDYTPTPAVVYTPHEEEANDLVQSLKGPLGFDMEWRVFFGGPSRQRPTALVQVCDERMILLVQVSAMSNFPQKLKEIIESSDVVKVGVNIRNDSLKLSRDYGVEAAGLVELGALAHTADPVFSTQHKRTIVSLAKVVEMYTSKTLDKGKVRTSNWETMPLTEAQITYAANDAHSALRTYQRLLEIAKDNETTLDPLTYTCSTTTTLTVTAASALASSSTTVKLASTTSTSTSATASSSAPSEDQREASKNLQIRRAYDLWHNHDMTLQTIRETLRTKANPLAKSTVITYVVQALQADPTLPYSMERLKAFVQLDPGSWYRHSDRIKLMDSRNQSSSA